MRTVFFFFDEPWALIGLKHLIQWDKYGFEICGTASNGTQAWNQIAALRPNVIFTDIRMPGQSGLELLHRIREAGMSSIVVIISGYEDFEYAREAVRYGAFDYLVKQVQSADMTDCLRRINEKLDRQTAGSGLVSAEKSSGESEKQGSRHRTDGENSSYLVTGTSAIVQGMISEISAHYRNPATLAEYAARNGVSQGYLSERIKKETGHTYSELLLKKRIEKAGELLQNSNLTIYDIAAQTGFCDYYYFAKTFRRQTGVTPTEYRKASRNRPDETDRNAHSAESSG